MDVTSIAALASQMATTSTQQAAQLAVLSKAMDLESQGAHQLVMAATQGSANPPGLGNSVDTFA